MSAEKITGFILLALGVCIVLYALFISYGIFVGLNEPPQIFSAPAAQESSGVTTNLENIEVSADALVQKQLANLLPQEDISQVLNLFVWSVFAGLLVFGGTQLASLGIKLLAIKHSQN